MALHRTTPKDDDPTFQGLMSALMRVQDKARAEGRQLTYRELFDLAKEQQRKDDLRQAREDAAAKRK
jgi:hypothetical protein